MSRILKRTDKVGYKCPPRERQWKKGHSGNPLGRAKGHKNLATVLAAVLSEKTAVTDGDRTRTMTKLEALTRQLVDRAVEGDPRVIGQLLAELHKNETAMQRDASADTLVPADQAVLKALYARLARHAVAMEKSGKKKARDTRGCVATRRNLTTKSIGP